MSGSGATPSSTLLIRRSSAGFRTSVVATAALLPRSVSVVVVDTVTPFDSVVPRVAKFGRTTTVAVRCAPLAIVPRLQVIVSAPPVVLPEGSDAEQSPDGATETKVTSAGSVSVTVTLSAGLSPLARFRAAMT